jgi:hypothetical protein
MGQEGHDRKPVWDSRDRTGQPGQGFQDRTAVIGQTGQDGHKRKVRTAGSGKPGIG